MKTEQQAREYFTHMGIKWDELNEKEKKALTETHAFAFYQLGLSWQEFKNALDEAVKKCLSLN